MKVMNNMTFEDAMARLEELVSKIENGSLTLDETLACYEEAMSLVRFCNSKIEDAEQKIRVLVESADGSVTDVPFASDNAD